ncbi:DUF6221 family protein [Nonomuraea sp. NPDC050310]|uniref:DUF6221 family protein n=1 Tax=Nonomuraea sp. NPDC050310 TaxID=3154935 RepID=UPI0033C3071D
MSSLIDFIDARLNEDARIARAVPVAKGCAPPAHWSPGADPHGAEQWVMGTFQDIDAHTPEAAEHIARHDPARVMREVEAKRRTLGLHRNCGSGSGYCDEGGHGWSAEAEGFAGCSDLVDLASPYSDHPDFRTIWRLVN